MRRPSRATRATRTSNLIAYSDATRNPKGRGGQALRRVARIDPSTRARTSTSARPTCWSATWPKRRSTSRRSTSSACSRARSTATSRRRSRSTKRERSNGRSDFTAAVNRCHSSRMAANPAELIASVERQGRCQRASCGAGAMVWRTWGRGRPVVLLHGASGSWTHWIRNVLPLATRVQVWAPDMPGFGGSDPVPEPHTADALADLARLRIDAVLPPPAPFARGLLVRRIIGCLVAARLGPRVRTLVLLGAAAWDAGSHAAAARSHRRRRVARRRPGRHRENLRR